MVESRNNGPGFASDSMSATHMSLEDLARLRRREVPAGELLPLLRHLGECAECAARAGELDVPRTLLDGDPGEHLDPEMQLIPYVDGELDAADREIVESHLDDCGMCRAEADDLRRLRQSMQQPRGRRWPVFAAAAAAAAVVLLLTVYRAPDEPAVTPAPRPRITAPAPLPPAIPADTVAATPSPRPARWQSLIEQTVKRGRLPWPSFIGELAGTGDVFRGTTEDGPSAALSPSGVVVPETRPRFSWAAREGATYVVSVFRGEEEVARSEALTTSQWTPPRPLRHGATYVWQVALTAGGETIILPAPPAPPATFRVVDAAAMRELQEVRAARPDDHLLHAVLAARAGLRAEAETSLRRAVEAGDRTAIEISRGRGPRQ